MRTAEPIRRLIKMEDLDSPRFKRHRRNMQAIKDHERYLENNS